MSVRSVSGQGNAWVAGLLSATAYGVTPTFAAIAHEGGVSPTVLVVLRSAIGGVLLLAVALATGRLRVHRRDAFLLTFVCGPLFAIQLLCLFAAITYTGAQVAVVIAHVFPVFVMVISAVWLGRRPSAASWLIGAVMITGIVFVAGAGGGHVVVRGALLAVACAAGYALYYLIGEPILARVSVITASGLTSLGAAAAAGVVLIFVPTTWTFTTAGWVTVLIQGAIMMPLGVGGAYVAVRTLGPVPGSLLSLFEAVVGVFAAALFLGETMVWQQWVGVAIVLGASAMLPWIRTSGGPPGGDDAGDGVVSEGMEMSDVGERAGVGDGVSEAVGR
ncbi:DMT family transporter [Gordonia soli]|nr:DMT family transporter [Gordonia soli]